MLMDLKHLFCIKYNSYSVINLKGALFTVEMTLLTYS